MQRHIVSLCALGLAACSADPASETPGEPEAPALTARENPDAVATAWVNGRWYVDSGTGIEFVLGDRYAVNGMFVDERPDNALEVDLEGTIVVPPYGEAHNHSVDGPGTEAAAAKYIAEGVFYYKNPNGLYNFAHPMRSYWDRLDTLDVTMSFGGLSSDEGHPEKLYKMLLGYGLYAGTDPEALDGEAFWDMSTLALLDEKWDAVLATEPDFLKLYLLEYDTDDNNGLTEDVFHEVIQRAKAAGLRTAVHVETSRDLALAVEAGADEAAHLPAYNYSIAKDDASAFIADEVIQQMAEQGFVVVATVNVSQSREYEDDSERLLIMDRQADNLRRMKAAGVPITVGSDTFFQTAWNEISSLRLLNVFTDDELLKMWVDTPSISIFPERAIGVLEPGYEASFLTLECDPRDDIECAIQIRQRIKNGTALDSEAP